MLSEGQARAVLTHWIVMSRCSGVAGDGVRLNPSRCFAHPSVG